MFEFLVLLKLALCDYQINHVSIPLIIFVRKLTVFRYKHQQNTNNIKRLNIKHHCEIWRYTLILFTEWCYWNCTLKKFIDSYWIMDVSNLDMTKIRNSFRNMRDWTKVKEMRYFSCFKMKILFFSVVNSILWGFKKHSSYSSHMHLKTMYSPRTREIKM